MNHITLFIALMFTKNIVLYNHRVENMSMRLDDMNMKENHLRLSLGALDHRISRIDSLEDSLFEAIKVIKLLTNKEDEDSDDSQDVRPSFTCNQQLLLIILFLVILLYFCSCHMIVLFYLVNDCTIFIDHIIVLFSLIILLHCYCWSHCTDLFLDQYCSSWPHYCTANYC